VEINGWCWLLRRDLLFFFGLKLAGIENSKIDAFFLKKMRFKIENADGSTRLVSSDALSSESTIKELLLILSAGSNLDIYYSYPRKKLDVSNTSVSIPNNTNSRQL
jgi:hypothetical protein